MKRKIWPNIPLKKAIVHFRNERGTAACFSKVPIINGPGKLSPFKDRGFNSFASSMIKLSVSETNGVVC